MDSKVAIFVLVFIIVLVILIMLGSRQNGKSCFSGMQASDLNKQNISGSKTWLSSNPTVGASDQTMDHCERDGLRSPLFPMRQILENLTLVEDHCIYQRRCYECLAKHMMSIEAWADFGGLLVGPATEDYGKIARETRDKLTEVRRLGMVKTRLLAWARELYNRIRALYPNLDVDYNQLQNYEVQELKVPLLPQRQAYFNLREIIKLLILMEVITAAPDLRCLECLRYFLTKAVALAREGSTMSSALRSEYENVKVGLDEKLAELQNKGIDEETSAWFRSERKRLIEKYPEFHEQALYKDYEKPVYLATCSETCS